MDVNQRGALNTRAVILDVAERALTDSGYQGVSLQAIARQIGVSKPALYHHFPGGKEELFVAILHRALDEARVGLDQAITMAGESGRDRMQATVVWLMDEPVRGRGLDRMHDVTRFVDASLQVDMAERYRLAHHEPIRAFVSAAMVSGEFRAADASFVAWSVLSLVAGMLEAASVPSATDSTPADGSADSAGAASQIVELVLNGVNRV